MKYLSEPEAWRKIGNDILNGGEMERGLCDVAHRLSRDGRIGYQTYATMSQRAMRHVRAAFEGEWPPVFLAPHGEEREARAMLAYLMALEAEDES